jgi:hypothetical protein
MNVYVGINVAILPIANMYWYGMALNPDPSSIFEAK